MKKTTLAVLLVASSAVVLAGCFSKKSDETAGEFTNPNCNEYIKLMKCVADKSGAGEQALAGLNQAIEAWKALPEDQLNQSCDAAMQAVASQKDAYAQMGCEVTVTDAQVEPTTEVMTGTETAMTGSETAMTGDEQIIDEVVNEVVSGTTAQ